jgi:cell shape-determining protein MreC
VGRVTEIRLRPDQSFAEIMAEPASALDRDREVLLVWNATDEAPHANEPASPQGADVAKARPTEAASLAKAK